MANESETELLRAERDLYRGLLELGSHEDVTPFLDDALALVVDVTGAHKGYLALHAPGVRDVAAAAPRFWISRGCSDREVEVIRAEISTGIVAEALRTGRTVGTASAAEDPRFRDLRSVQAGRIQAVLCAPIGGAAPMGVLYLQGRAAPGPFPERERALVELFAQRLSPLAQRVLTQREAAPRVDHTTELRGRLRLEGLVGVSRALADAFQKLAVAAPVDVTVLLLGESGTGKTAFARALHDNSRRARGPFVEINCAALPETLVEAELFGAEKGAHSTATRRVPGRIAAAQGGTLFLDEVGELPLASQAKLLQFLQSKRYYRLGGDSPVEADVRLVAATNADLETLIREKRFREDLYYRLNVLTLRVPALSERADDVPVLAEHFTAAAAGAFGRALSLSWTARAALASASWPGNVRQLAAAIQRGAAFAIGEAAEVIDARHLFPESAASGEAAPVTYQEATRRFQKRFLQEALEACNGNVSEVARRLDVARSHLHELLRAHGLGRAGR
jgi:Nif-specific regulatory protein